LKSLRRIESERAGFSLPRSHVPLLYDSGNLWDAVGVQSY